tara:strand:- start:115 stop:822 length:708 start_codon:yes stop_codon:yes gene_type:complete
MIELKKVYKEYVNDEVVTKVLFDINLKINKGEYIAIMGPSGSGKSTLMHILGLLDTPTKGEYFFNNKKVSKMEDEELSEYRNKKIGFVFQNFNLLPKTSVWDNVYLPLFYSKDKVNIKDVDKSIEEVGLKHRRDYLSNQLSGGEKQRVAIARSLVNNPDIIFADEPTGNLDSKTGLQIVSILKKLNDHGKTIILVTHEKITSEYANRIISMNDGKIIKDTEEFKTRKVDKNTQLK